MVGNGMWSLAPGQVTDDSELAMALMRALIEAQGKLDPTLHCKYYGTWYQHNPIFVGPSTANALSRINLEKIDPNAPLEAAKEMNSGSRGNGAMMKVSPLAVWAQNLPDE